MWMGIAQLHPGPKNGKRIATVSCLTQNVKCSCCPVYYCIVQKYDCVLKLAVNTVQMDGDFTLERYSSSVGLRVGSTNDPKLVITAYSCLVFNNKKTVWRTSRKVH